MYNTNTDDTHNNETMESVLIHHGILPTVDDAREAGLIYACLGCGTVAGINPADGEAGRIATKNEINWDEFDCCPEFDTILF